MKKRVGSLCAVCVFLLLCTGCSQSTSSKQPEAPSAGKENTETQENGSGGKGDRPWEAKVLVPEAPGGETYEMEGVSLDVSNASEGYVMLNYSGSNSRVKLQIVTPEGIKYTYEVTEYGKYRAYPLPGGSATYGFTIYEVADEEKNLFAVAMSQEISVNISDEFKIFLYPNCYVEFDASSACVRQGEELARGCDTDLDVVASVYDYVTGNIVYDDAKAETVQTGYTADPDDTLATGKGICFDYASLMSSMLRSQQIPTRLEVGYVGELYHAWISCYVEEIGWVDDIIEFDGSEWTMMDPTMAASGGSKEVLRLKEEKGYIVKYTY